MATVVKTKDLTVQAQRMTAALRRKLDGERLMQIDRRCKFIVTMGALPAAQYGRQATAPF